MRSLRVLVVCLAACGHAGAPVAPTAEAGRETPSADALREEPIDLAITFDPRITGNIGWDKLPEPIPLAFLGDLGATVVEATSARAPFRPDHPLYAGWLGAALARPEASTLIVDQANLCSAALVTFVDRARPGRMLVTVEGGIDAKSVACLQALSTPRLYLTGCLHRAHDPRDTCDGDAEIDALAAAEGLRSRVFGLALSLGSPAALEKLAKFPALEYLALSPGRAATARALFDELPFDRLPHVRYFAAEGENEHGRAFGPDALRFIGNLHTLRWRGELGAPIPSPCRLERARFDQLRSESVRALGACSALKELSSDDAPIDSAEPLVRLGSLERLDLRHLRAPDLALLAQLTRLEHLSLDASHAESYAFVTRLTQLRSLDLSQTSLSTLAGFEALEALEDLDVGFTTVGDLAPLRSLGRLVRLKLHATTVSDLTVVSRLPRLVELSVSETPVKDLAPLANHPALERVLLYGSAVKDASALLTLPRLKRANVKGLALPREQIEALRKTLGRELYD